MPTLFTVERVNAHPHTIAKLSCVLYNYFVEYDFIAALMQSETMVAGKYASANKIWMLYIYHRESCLHSKSIEGNSAIII